MLYYTKANILDQNRQYRDRKIERAKYAAEMDAKIAKLMTSKKQIRTLTRAFIFNISYFDPESRKK